MFFRTVHLEYRRLKLIPVTMKPALPLYRLVLPALLLAAPAQAQVTARATELRAEPQPAAKTVASLPAAAKVAIGKRDGFWVQVSAGAARGWLRVTDLSFAQPGGAVSLAGLDSGRLGKNNIVSTSAARGLSAADLQHAKPDFAAVAALASLSAHPANLQAFRAAGALREVTLAPLALRPAGARPAAAAPTSASTSAAKGNNNEDW
jgi:hypothetical protein